MLLPCLSAPIVCVQAIKSKPVFLSFEDFILFNRLNFVEQKLYCDLINDTGH